MRVRPAQGGLKHQVQSVETKIERHLEAPEDSRLHIVESDLEAGDGGDIRHAASVAGVRVQFQGAVDRDRGAVVVDAGQDIGEPSLGIDVVEPGRLDQRVHEGGPLTTAIGAGEQPGLAAERNAAQRPLGGVVGEADAAVGEEAREGLQRLSM